MKLNMVLLILILGGLSTTTFAGDLVWNTTRADALAEIVATGKTRLFVLVGNEDCHGCHNTMDFWAEYSSVKPILEAHYVLWYHDEWDTAVAGEVSEYYEQMSPDLPATLPITWVVNASDVNNTIALAVHDGELYPGGIFEGVITPWIPTNSPVVNPTASNAIASVVENGSADITLTGSGAGELIFAVDSQPTNGSLSGTAPSLTYQPNADYVGADSFTFTVTDTNSTSAAATISITVNAASGGASFSGVTNIGSEPEVAANVIAQSITISGDSGVRTVKWTAADATGGAGQTFTATKTATAGAIDLKMSSSESFSDYATASFKLKLFEGGLGSTTLLGTYSYDVTALADGVSGEWLRFGLDSGVVLTEGTLYSFMVVNGSEDVDHNMTFSRTKTSGDYEGGNELLLGNLYDVENFDTDPWDTSDPIGNDVSNTAGDLLFSVVVGSDSGGDPDVDSDGDGLTDAQEVALGTDLGDPNSVFVLDDATVLSATGKMRIEWQSRTGVNYRIRTSSNLVDWSTARDWLAAQTPPLDQVDLDLGLSNGFFKVEAEIQ